MFQNFEDMLHHPGEVRDTGKHHERHGIVTSYDPKNYQAKVTIMPDGMESGWLPIHTGHIGKGYGLTMGLQPGSDGMGGGTGGAGGGSGGGQSGGSQQMGDQVIVQMQEGQFDSGKIVSRVHSEMDTPPMTNSGEMIMWTVFKQDDDAGGDSASSGQSQSDGQTVYFKNDGSFNFTDGGGAIHTLDGKGNVTVTSL
jgi:hypothetical protein